MIKLVLNLGKLDKPKACCSITLDKDTGEVEEYYTCPFLEWDYGQDDYGYAEYEPYGCHCCISGKDVEDPDELYPNCPIVIVEEVEDETIL